MYENLFSAVSLIVIDKKIKNRNAISDCNIYFTKFYKI